MGEIESVNPYESSAEPSASPRPGPSEQEVTSDSAATEFIKVARQWSAAIPAMQITLACWLLLVAAVLVLTVIVLFYLPPAFLARISPLGWIVVGTPLVLEFALLLFLNNYIGRVHHMAASPSERSVDSALRGSTSFWLFFVVTSVVLLAMAIVNFLLALNQYMDFTRF